VAASNEDANQLTDEYHRACGEAIRAWADLEYSAVLYLQVLLQTDEQFRAKIIWATLPNWQLRRKLLLRLGEAYLDDAFIPKFRKLLFRMNTLARKRNLIAHARCSLHKPKKVVFINDDDDNDVGFSFLAKEEYQFENLRNWAKNINNLHVDMMICFEDLHAAVHTSSKMHRAQQDGHARSSDQSQQESTDGEPEPPP
jgi:hypothetical protein